MSIHCNTTVTGETGEAPWEDREFFTYDVPNVHVNINEDDDKPKSYCANCNAGLDSEGVAIDNGPWDTECPENPQDEEDEGWEDTGQYGRHSPVPIPLSWINSVNILAKEEKDELAVTISVGDPRGAFVMRVERMRYTGDDGQAVDQLRLSVPHPMDSEPHTGLTPLASPGYYAISSIEGNRKRRPEDVIFDADTSAIRTLLAAASVGLDGATPESTGQDEYDLRAAFRLLADLTEAVAE